MSALSDSDGRGEWDGPIVPEVFEVKDILREAPPTGSLPIEIIDIILDFAEYWPHTSSMAPDCPRTAYGTPGETWVKDIIVARSLPLGCPPNGNHDGDLLKSHSNYPNQFSYPNPYRDLSAELKAKQNSLLSFWSSYSKPQGKHPCRKIVFTIRSHDQGWGGDEGLQGTYEGSYTWFDVGLERIEIFPGKFVDLPLVGELQIGNDAGEGKVSTLEDKLYCLRTIQPPSIPTELNPQIYELDHPFLAPANCLQLNRTASILSEEHIITWSWDDAISPESQQGKNLEKIGRGCASGTGEFVRNLSLGDVVTVWARARFPQWVNVVQFVKIDVYWAV